MVHNFFPVSVFERKENKYSLSEGKRNEIRGNNEGVRFERRSREIKAENHVTAKSFERAYITLARVCAFFARSFKRCHGDSVPMNVS